METKLVEYLSTARLGERGTMTLPKEYRDELRLETGAPMTILRIGDGLILIPEQVRFQQLCDSIATKLEKISVTEAELQSTLPAVREKLAKQHYPELFNEKNKNTPLKKLGSRKRTKK